MDFGESLDYLYGLQRFGIKLGLENIRILLDRLGHPERRLQIIHVAGSNGKGSTCAALSAIMEAAGRRTGLYTSPHLHAFTERIRVNGEAIAETDVAALVNEIRIAAAGIPITFFEFTTAMALLYFSRQEVEVAILEVGMGGRLDATNVVTPRVTVVTPVCLDHAEHLGPDLATIAGEKGGIIKYRVPVVIAPQEPEAMRVLFARAAEMEAPVHLCGRDFHVEQAAAGFTFRSGGHVLPDLHPGLPGRHQQINLAVALAAALLFAGAAGVPDSALRSGVEKVAWPGRLEWWGGSGKVLLDGAHNQGGARILADYLDSLPTTEIRWVVGLKGDKRAGDILQELLPRCSALYCTAPPVDSPFSPNELAALAAAGGRPAAVYPDAAAALNAALGDSRPGGVVLVAGSLFLVAAAREHLSHQGQRIPA